jgi:putative ABC transport system substrate-binding protein
MMGEEVEGFEARSMTTIRAGNVERRAGRFKRDPTSFDAALTRIAPFEISRAEDIAPAFEALKGRVEALYVSFDLLTIVNRVRINTLASAGRVPTMFGTRDYVEAGGLMSYGPNIQDLWRRAAEYVDKVLRGAKPADMPVEQPTKFELIINLTTAKALGLTIPPGVLAIADEVIE